MLLTLAGAWSCGREPTASGGQGGVRERWYQAQPGDSWARPAVVGDLVYFGTGDGQVIARDVATGAPRWAARVGADRVKGANVVVRNGVVAVSLVRHTVGLDATTGRELWRYAAPPDTVLAAVPAPGQVVESHLDADDQTLYVPAWGASVSALDLHTGAVRWVWQPGRAPTDTAASGLFRSGAEGARVSGDTVFVTAWHFLVENGVRSEAWLLALDRATGRELWRAVLPNARGGVGVLGAPALVGRYAIFNTTEVRVYALDRATGRLAWEFKAPASALTPTSQVEAYGDVLYVDGGDSHIHALRAQDGAVLWRGAIQAQAFGDLLATERRLAVPVGRYLYVLDRATGRQVAEVTHPRTSDPLFASPLAYAAGRLFATVNGAAWSFDEP